MIFWKYGTIYITLHIFYITYTRAKNSLLEADKQQEKIYHADYETIQCRSGI